MLFPRALTGLWALQAARSEARCASSRRLCLPRDAWSLLPRHPGAPCPVPHFVTVAVGAGKAPRAQSFIVRARRLLDIYKKLSKAKLSGFVVATACTGYVLGSGESVDWAGLGWTGLGTMGAAACANTLNQIIEVGNDRLMGRTASRPLPSGRMSVGHAACFAAVVGLAGVGVLAWKTNALTASLGAANIGLYAGVYTAMKRLTPWNTWVGAVVGAVPPVMGWTAASGSIDVGAGVLAAVLYFWQIPHFLALAWLCRDDYARAGFRMLSRYDTTGRRLASCALRNSLYLFPLGIVATWLGLTSPPFAYETAACSVAMGITAAAFYQAPSKVLARTMFKSSLVFLPILMAAIVVHRQPHHRGGDWQVLRHKASGGLYPLPAGMRVEDGREDWRWEFSLRSVQAAPFPFSPLPCMKDATRDWDAGSDGDGDEEERESKRRTRG